MKKKIILILFLIITLWGCGEKDKTEDKYAELRAPGDGTTYYRYVEFNRNTQTSLAFNSDFKLGTEVYEAIRSSVPLLVETYGEFFRITKKQTYTDDEEYLLFSVNDSDGEFAGTIVCNLDYGAYPVLGDKSSDIDEAIYALRGYDGDAIYSVERDEEGNRYFVYPNGMRSERPLNEKGYSLIESIQEEILDICGKDFFLYSLSSGHDGGHLICVLDIQSADGENIGIMYDQTDEEIVVLTGNYTGDDRKRIRAEEEWEYAVNSRTKRKKD